MKLEVKFEELIGQTVRNTHGRAIGRIADARIEPDGDDYLVTHFLLGPLERVPRLLAWVQELSIVGALGVGHKRQLRPLPWHWIDLSDPERPVLAQGAE
jgi:sporulation protein YlmC with PRC-barrel domain